MLPTIADMTGFQFSYLGQPFVEGPAKSTIDTTHFEYSFLGQPYVRNGSATTTNTTNFFFMWY